MGDIINLKNARKQRERDNKNKESAIKRVKFGAKRDEKNIIKLSQEKHEKKLDNHKLDNKTPVIEDDESL